VDDRDSWKVHFRDTMKGGKYLGQWRMAQIHAQEAPDRVNELEEWGAVFDRTEDGRILQRNFGGHSHPRLAHVGDRTGLELIRTLQDKGVHMLDSPVSGGVWGAQRGSLQVMVGGDEGIYNEVKGVLKAIGDKVGYMGPIGAGTIAKLVHNMISIASRGLIAEGFTLGVKAGVKPEALLEAIRGASYGQGLMLSQMIPNVIFKGDFDSVRFALKLARKDIGLATELAREYDVPMPMAALAEQTMMEALARGWGDKDSTSPWMLQEEAAGVKVRATS